VLEEKVKQRQPRSKGTRLVKTNRESVSIFLFLTVICLILGPNFLIPYAEKFVGCSCSHACTTCIVLGGGGGEKELKTSHMLED